MKGLFSLSSLVIIISITASVAFADIKAAANLESRRFSFHFFNIGDSAPYHSFNFLNKLLFGNEEPIQVYDLGIVEIKENESILEYTNNLSVNDNIPDGIIRAYDSSGYQQYFSPKTSSDSNKSIFEGFNAILKEHPAPVAELPFKNNKLNGILKIYYLGDLYLYEIPFEDNVIAGSFKIYKNGIIYKEANYTNGNINGKMHEYNNDGTKYVKDINFVNGEIDGDSNEYIYDSNILVKQILCKYKEGTILARYVYKDGILSEQTAYDKKGQPNITTKYNSKGEIVGTIDNAKERKEEAKQREKEAKEIEKENAKSEAEFQQLKSKLSQIRMYHSYEDIVAFLGRPSGVNMVEVYGNGFVTWYYAGHKIDMQFENRFVKTIMIDNQFFRVFNMY